MPFTPDGVFYPDGDSEHPSEDWWVQHTLTEREARIAVATRVGAIESADTLTGDDPRAPRLGSDTYTHTLVDAGGRLGLGIRVADGVVEAPAGVHAPSVGLPVEGYSWAVTDRRGRLSELVLDEDGRLPQWVAAAIVARGTGTTSSGDGTKSAPLEVTRPNYQTGFTLTDTQRQVRYPVRPTHDVTSWRAHLANFNEQTDEAFPDVALTGVWVGPAVLDGNGRPTGAWAGTPRKVAPATTVTAAGIVTDPVEDYPLRAGTTYLIALAYTGATQVVRTHAGCWTSTTAADVTVTSPAGQSQSTTGPLQVTLVCDIDRTVPVVGMLGDSLTVGQGTLLPVHDSVVTMHAQRWGTWPVNLGQHGGTLGKWATPGTREWTKYAALGCARLDGVLIAAGSNDLFAGEAASAATCAARLAVVVALVREHLCDRVHLATIMPRNYAHDTQVDIERAAYNAHLATLPHHALTLSDFAASVAAPGDPNAVRPEYDDDGVHLTTAGYQANAAAITTALAAATIRPLT